MAPDRNESFRFKNGDIFHISVQQLVVGGWCNLRHFDQISGLTSPVSQYICVEQSWTLSGGFVITVIIFVCVYHLFRLGELQHTLDLETSPFVFNISENSSNLSSAQSVIFQILKFTSRHGHNLMMIFHSDN